MYLLPFFIGVIAFTLYPVINVIVMSFKEDYSYLTREFAQWGVDNYSTVLNDSRFRQAIGNTLKYVVLVVPISTCCLLYTSPRSGSRRDPRYICRAQR